MAYKTTLGDIRRQGVENLAKRRQRAKWRNRRDAVLIIAAYLVIGVVAATLLWGEPTLSFVTAVRVIAWPIYVVLFGFAWLFLFLAIFFLYVIAVFMRSAFR